MTVLDRMAKRYGQRPSAVLGIDDPWVAYQFDLTVMYVADAPEGGAVSGPPRAPSGVRQRRFASLAGGLGKDVKVRKMKIPESGIW